MFASLVKHLAKTGTFAGLYQTDQAVLISLQNTVFQAAGLEWPGQTSTGRLSRIASQYAVALIELAKPIQWGSVAQVVRAHA